MKLSVVLPCFNGADTIAVQLEALVNQQWTGQWEVIISNNGSTDASMAIVNRYRDRLPDLKIVNAYQPPAPRLGAAHSYNVGMKAASGDAFVFCEADDEVDLGWLAAMAGALAQYDFIACRLEYAKLNEPWRLEAYGERGQSKGLTQLDIPPYLPFANGCSLGLKRCVYKRVGEFNTSLPYSFEADFCWRAQFAGFQLHFVPEAVVQYRLRHTFRGIYRQARNYGKDLIFLRKYYQDDLGKLAPVRQFLEILASLPKGLQQFIAMQMQASCAKGQFAMWFWFLGLRIGIFAGLMQKLPVALQENPTYSQFQLKLSESTALNGY